MNISIFAKPAFLNTASNTAFISKEKSYKGHGHLQRVSSVIRGDQIADYLGAKYNPESGYEDDVCIYVKPHLKRGNTNFKFEKRSYMDIVDGWGLLPLLEENPEVGVIVCSKQDAEKLSFLENKVVFIPQHHVNYDREKRTRKGIKTVGIIGTADAFEYLPDTLRMRLMERGIELKAFSKFFSRQDIIDFYKDIDIQIVWRPYRMRLSNPLKLVNAASFGIPTIALAEDVFKELEDCYIGVRDLEGFLRELDRLIEKPEVYQELSDNCLQKSEEYHISKVAELYKELK